jgi:hypothetical protein
MTAELVLSEVNHHHLGRLAHALEEPPAASWYSRAKWLARAGLGLRVARRWLGPWTEHLASAAFMGAALCFRFAWVRAGRASAHDDEAVARMARARATRFEPSSGELRVTQHR